MIVLPLSHPVHSRWAKVFSLVVAVQIGGGSGTAAAAGPNRYISARAYFHALRAELLQARGDAAAAAKALEVAVVFDPESHFLHLSLARLAWAREQSPALVDRLVARAIRLAPWRAGGWLLRGRVLAARGQARRADKAWRRAIAVAPRSEDAAEAAIELSGLLGKQGRTREAVRVLRATRSHRRGMNLDLVDAEARALANGGDVEGGEALLLDVADAWPDHRVEALHRLAMLRAARTQRAPEATNP